MGDKFKNSNDYNRYVNEVTPTTNTFLNVIKAFFTGGLICLIGQVILKLLMMTGMSKDNAILCQILILVGLAVLLTGFNVYYKIVKFGGAGALVPITGFANSVASPAIEYKKEGQVFGIGCKIFTIAGPVILYGIFCSFVLGLIYYLWGVITNL